MPKNFPKKKSSEIFKEICSSKNPWGNFFDKSVRKFANFVNNFSRNIFLKSSSIKMSQEHFPKMFCRKLEILKENLLWNYLGNFLEDFWRQFCITKFFTQLLWEILQKISRFRQELLKKFAQIILNQNFCENSSENVLKKIIQQILRKNCLEKFP